MRASLASARATLLAFHQWQSFMPRYTGAGVLCQLPNGNLKVYMNVTMPWPLDDLAAETEVSVRVSADGKTEVHEANLLGGNLLQFKAIWTLRQVSADTTGVSFDLLVQPCTRAPDFAIAWGNADSAERGLVAMTERMEKNASRPPPPAAPPPVKCP